MHIRNTVLTDRVVDFEDFRLTYTLFRTLTPDHQPLPVYGLECTAHRCAMPAGSWRCSALTDSEPAARRLLDLLAENAVFPDHIDDVLHDLRDRWAVPMSAAV